MNSLIDRRKHTRFHLREGVYAGQYPNIGEIVDISLGGIAYNYMEVANDADNEEAGGGFVIRSDDGATIESLPSKVVSDKVVNNGSSFSIIITRQCRMMFDSLTEEQKNELIGFIQTHKT